MTANRTAPFLARLHPAADEPDADLVRRYAAGRDAAAFEALVRRHGPLVFGVCRRALGRTHDAEDALQAVFLVFAQKVGNIREPAAVSAWLYGVAVRVAKRAKGRAARRREEPRAELPDAATVDPIMSDVGPVLDEELAALPAWYRDAVLACDVEELSRAAAAVKLGVPEGTLSSRLAKGRKLLAERLARRGVTLAVPLTAAVASAAVPEAVIQQTLETMAHWAAGGAVAKPIADLTHGGMTMVRTVLLLGAGVLTASAVGIGLAGSPDKPADKPAAQPAPAAVADAAKPAARFGPPRPRAIVNVPGRMAAVHWSADGQRVAVSGSIRSPAQQFGASRSVYEAFKLTDGDLQTLDSSKGGDGVAGDVLGIPTDLGAVLLHVAETGGINVRNSFVLTAAGQAKPVDLTDDSLGFLSMSADGRAVLMQSYDEAEKTTAVHEIDFATGKSKRVVFRTTAEVMTVSPDGGTVVTATREKRKVKSVVPNGSVVEMEEQFVDELTVWDAKSSQKRFAWKLPNRDCTSVSLALTPDGKSLAIPLDEACYLLDGLSGREIRRFPAGEKRAVSYAVLSADGRLAAVMEYAPFVNEAAVGGGPPVTPARSPNFVTVFDTATGKAVKKWETNLNLTLAFAPNRPTLAVLECPEPPRGDGPMGGPPGAMMGMGGGGMAATGRLGLWDFAAAK